MPWIAATTGFEQFSIVSTTSGSHGSLRRLAEFGDVGAGEEGLAFAGDDHRLDAVVGLRLGDRSDQPLADRGAERVHRRVVAK